VIVFQDIDPTTEVLAKDLYDYISDVLKNGFAGSAAGYAIPAGKVHLDRVRVWETPTSWAEYGD
jgi:6-pyruvoyltetrahydropterin/6-carboxytetrahydropterin synthase